MSSFSRTALAAAALLLSAAFLATPVLAAAGPAGHPATTKTTHTKAKTEAKAVAHHHKMAKHHAKAKTWHHKKAIDHKATKMKKEASKAAKG